MAFFYNGLPWRSGMVNGGGAANYRRIAYHPLVDRYRSAQHPLCLCRDWKEEMGEEVLTIARPDRPPTGFVDAHFLPATCSPARVVRPYSWRAPLILLPSLGARGGSGLWGLSSLDC